MMVCLNICNIIIFRIMHQMVANVVYVETHIKAPTQMRLAGYMQREL